MKDDPEEIEGGDLIELDFLEAVSARLPKDDGVLKALGDLYTRAGRYEDGLNIDRRLTAICREDPWVWYNLACSQALLGQREAALKSLQDAVRLGYSDHEWMSSDSDLRSLRDEQGFKFLIHKLSTRQRKKQSNSENA